MCVHESRGGAERWGRKVPSRLHAVRAEPNVGLKLRNCETVTQAEIEEPDDQPTEPSGCP